MVQAATLDAQERTKTGSAEARRLRKQGLCPGSLYGGGSEPVAFAISQDLVRALLNDGTRIVNLTVSGKTETAMVQDLQWDVFSTHVTHIDLLRVDATQRVQVDISVASRGVAPGVIAGGKLIQGTRRVTVDCLALEIPEAIQVNLNDMEIGDTITVGDLELPEGATVESPEPSTPVFQIIVSSDEDEDEAPADAGPVEPELIGRSSDDDSDDS